MPADSPLLYVECYLQETIAKLRSEHKSHPKALAQLEKQKQALENKVEAVERKQTALERDNKGLQEKLAKQEAEKVTLQEQVKLSLLRNFVAEA